MSLRSNVEKRKERTVSPDLRPVVARSPASSSSSHACCRIYRTKQERREGQPRNDPPPATPAVGSQKRRNDLRPVVARSPASSSSSHAGCRIAGPSRNDGKGSPGTILLLPRLLSDRRNDGRAPINDGKSTPAILWTDGRTQSIRLYPVSLAQVVHADS